MLWNACWKMGLISAPFLPIMDRIAVGAIGAARSGPRVPEQVSVVGFDDMPLASYFDPPLTTMRQDIFSIGREAARQLIWQIEHLTEPAPKLKIATQLVIRNSTSLYKDVP